MAISSSSLPFDEQSQQTQAPLRFNARSFGKYVEQVRELAAMTREPFVEFVNEVIAKHNEHLPLSSRGDRKKEKIPTFSLRIYANLERDERYPTFGELE